MKIRYTLLISALLIFAFIPLFGQVEPNCFLEDFFPKYASVPLYNDLIKTASASNVTVTINGSDTLGKISNYLFGNAVAVWVAQNVNNPALINHLQKLAPTLIRFPGGSWSDIYFWNEYPGDVPDSIYDGTTYDPANPAAAQKIPLYPQVGSWYPLTVDSYYNMCDQLGSQGLITINYGYARYGLSADPVTQAAHLAADWVRYDNGRTSFWEIGNEDDGPWEAGWMIDTTTNMDGQPTIISGQLYGRHFKVFVDSMKAAAAEVGTTIYIGGQILHVDGTGSWNIADRLWNEGFFSEVGDSADFYVMHNYFGFNGSTIKAQVDNARSEIINNINFIRQDIINKGAYSKPVAMTEWNCEGPDAAKTSIANGMQAVVLLCEMLRNNFGMSARWLIANWDADGMFYYNSSPIYPLWNPRPDFYYVYYLQHFVGDHMLSTSVTSSPTYSDILAYASKYYSGHAGVVVMNKGSTNKVVRINPNDIGVGDRFYIYSLTGADVAVLPQSVAVNGYNPTGAAWGPLDTLTYIRAWAYPIGDTIVFTSPAKSVQYILIDNGSRYLTAIDERDHQVVERFALHQNYPNPFNPQTIISYSLPRTSTITLKVFDVMGREVATLIHDEKKVAGVYNTSFDATNLSSGIYFYRLYTGNFVDTKKMIFIK